MAFSVLLVSSYIVDWVVLIAIAAVGAGFSQIGPRKRPFDITDRSISYPLQPETVTNSTLILASLVAPAAIIFIGSVFIRTQFRSQPSRKSSLRRKLWEWNAGWMGLALAYAVAFTITNGAKEVLGKPRPNLLARCNPDISRQSSAIAGGIGDQIEEGISLFDWRICRNTGSLLDEGFRSFPSGHSSLAFAGLVYLALWLCAKLGISVPYLGPQNLPSTSDMPNLTPIAKKKDDVASARTQAAAPPTYLIIFPLIPIGGAIFISSTRYSDFWHHGFDVLTSAILGILTAWLGFRWYHMPIQAGGGWAWAPRSPKRAYWKSMGVLTYGDSRDQTSRDPERGGVVGGQFPLPPSSRSAGHETSDGSGGSYEMNNFATAGQEPRDFTAHERTQPGH